jgi:signal transduction histidine kinase
MREEHQRLEVAAVRAAELFGRGMDEAGEASMDDVVEHAGTFLESVEGFARMRQRDLAGLWRRQDAAFRMLYVGGTAAALFALVGTLAWAWDFERRVRRPLAELATATERMGGGDLTVRVSTAPDLELRTLADGFNRMAASLEHAARELEGRNEELVSALDQVRAAQAELIQAEKLSAIGRMTAGFAHELNNPLASVLGYVQLLDTRLAEGEAPTGAEIRADFLEPVLREADRARHLVRTLLRTSHRPEADLVPVRLAGTLDVVRTLRAYAFEQAGLRLEIDVPDVWVMAEPQMLQSVLLNLVNNALDAMAPRPGGTLRIGGRLAEDGQVELLLEDDGPGIEEPDRVFEPFFTTKPVGQGTGLGLALVHQFVSAFGGSVSVGNRPEGGARIRLRLPAAPAPEHADSVPDSPAAAAVTPQAPVSAGPGPTPPPPDDPPAARRTRRILVVEDEEFLRRLQSRILERLDADIVLATSAGEAREVLRVQAIDLVISDVRMPGESGVDLFRWVCRERPDLVDGFLFVTGDASAQELVALVEERPDRVLHKPFQVQEYLARVTAALG